MFSDAKACVYFHSLGSGGGKKVLNSRVGCWQGRDDCGARPSTDKNQADTYQHIDVHLEEGAGGGRRKHDVLLDFLRIAGPNNYFSSEKMWEESKAWAA